MERDQTIHGDADFPMGGHVAAVRFEVVAVFVDDIEQVGLALGLAGHLDERIGCQHGVAAREIQKSPHFSGMGIETTLECFITVPIFRTIETLTER